MTPADAASEPNPHRGHEQTDVSPGPVVLVGAGIAVGTLVAAAVAFFLFGHYAEREARQNVPRSPLEATFRAQPPEPRLQTEPIRDLEELRAGENAILSSYGWVDRPNGVVRIPIERAIDLVAGEGLPSPGGSPSGARWKHP